MSVAASLPYRRPTASETCSSPSARISAASKAKLPSRLRRRLPRQPSTVHDRVGSLHMIASAVSARPLAPAPTPNDDAATASAAATSCTGSSAASSRDLPGTHAGLHTRPQQRLASIGTSFSILTARRSTLSAAPTQETVRRATSRTLARWASEPLQDVGNRREGPTNNSRRRIRSTSKLSRSPMRRG
jgi:hypothetical protein